MIDRRDLDFVLYELLQVEELLSSPAYASHDKETFVSVLEMAEQLARDLYLDHAKKVDEHEPEFNGESVVMIPEVGQALEEYYAAGFGAMTFSEEEGGMQLPWIIAQACTAIFMSANVSTASYSMLTNAAANLLAKFGSDAQKAAYLKDMLSGRCFGTMCLSEPHAGSSLADIRTKAVATPEGHYSITGTKMWVSGGEQQISENIAHMVLARIHGAPQGVKGISLFLVPKLLPTKNGSPRKRNDITLGGINHKMGYRGTVNTLLNFGENGSCIGYLVGESNQGLRYMFHMMNEARIGIGLGATAIAYAGYISSLSYAKERSQGRHPDNDDPSTLPVDIIEHADVRRLLLAQKAYVEGALALVLYCARLVDEKRFGQPEDVIRLEVLLDLLTPIVKSWPSEFCLEANKYAIQVLGGYGYSREYPVERLYRDNRLNAIHEGTHGIQGIDLLARKIARANGQGLQILLGEVSRTLADAGKNESLSTMTDALTKRCDVVRHITNILINQLTNGDKRLALANATLYLDALGHIVIAWMWLKQAVVAGEKIRCCVGSDEKFYTGKLYACRYFYRYELPKVDPVLALLGQLDDTCLKIPADAF